MNDSIYDVTGQIELYDNSGNPLSLTLNGTFASAFPFSLAKGSQGRFRTKGDGDLKVGWALILSDQPLECTSGFEIRDASGRVYGDVGISESIGATKFTIFSDTLGPSTNTGLALVNPSSVDPNNLLLELMDPTGKKISEMNLRLGPREHIARFLTEFYPKIAGIEEFEGSMVISSVDNRKFGGITLRITGDQMTTLPMVIPPPAGTFRNRLYFPQVADGLLNKLRYTTSIFLFNNTGKAANATVEFFNSDTTPMNVTIEGKTAATFDYNLSSGGVKRLVTSGAGAARVGWARVKMDQPISGSAMFQVFSDTGSLLTEVGVSSATPTTRFNLITDGLRFFDTGIAIANPSEDNQSAYVSMSLLDKSGVSKATTSFNLKVREHRALFIGQLFPNVAGIDEFEGMITFASGGTSAIIPLSLRSIDEKLTSVPTLRHVHGFAPQSIIEPVQNLAGTAPAFRWRIHQHWDDLSVASIKVSAPEMGLKTTGRKIGDEIGYGVFVLDNYGSFTGGVLKLSLTSLTDGLGFSSAASSLGVSSSSKIQLSGRIQGTAGGGCLWS